MLGKAYRRRSTDAIGHRKVSGKPAGAAPHLRRSAGKTTNREGLTDACFIAACRHVVRPCRVAGLRSGAARWHADSGARYRREARRPELDRKTEGGAAGDDHAGGE